MEKNNEKKEYPIIILKETENEALYKCDLDELSEYFVKRQIDDYCVFTQGVIPN